MTSLQRTCSFASALMMSAVLVVSNASADLKKIGKAGSWEILGDSSSCQATKALKGREIGQFAIGITNKSETFFTFQNLSWRGQTRTRKLPVNMALDNKMVLKARAINLMQFGTLQIITSPTKPALWQNFLRAKTITISGKFNPGSATFRLDNPSRIVPLMKTCLARHLPGTAAPF